MFQKMMFLAGCGVLFLVLFCAASASAETCGASDVSGMVMCLDVENGRFERVLRDAEDALLSYCLKTVGPTECGDLTDRIESRRKYVEAWKAYVQGLETVKGGLKDAGRAVNGVLKDTSRSLEQMIGEGDSANSGTAQ